jgi:hypothetical protein
MLGHGALGELALGEATDLTQALAPGLFTNTNSFFAPTVGRGAVTLSPPLLSDADSFFAPTVGRGAVTLSPPLLVNANTLFPPLVTQGNLILLPPLLDEGDTFFAPVVGRGPVTLAAPLLVNSSILFAPKVAMRLSPPLLSDVDSFFAPTVSRGPVTLLPALFTDPDTFFSPTVSGGEVVDAPTAFRQAVAAQHSRVPLPWLVTIDHPSLPNIIRWVNNPVPVVSRGQTFIARAFKVQRPADGDETPSLVVTLSNHDRVLGKALEALEGFPGLKLERILLSFPDDPVETYEDFTSASSRWDASAVEVTLSQEVFWNETYPLVRVTPRKFPGLFLS